MKGRYFVLAIGCAALLLLSLREGNQGVSTPATVIPLDQASRGSVIAMASETPKNETSASSSSSPTTEPAGQTKEWKPSLVPAISPATKSRLKEFSRLKKKVFLDNDERRALSELTRDPGFLASLAPLFDIAAERDETDLNAAIDLLLDAATREKSETATSVLMGVIADPSIENTSIPSKRREELAGIKGEIMFLWTAASPERARYMASMLPGPVTQKVWENVLAAQERNRNESMATSQLDDGD